MPHSHNTSPAASGVPSAADHEQTLESRLRAGAVRAGCAPAIRDAAGVRATHHDLRRIRDGGRLRLREAGVGRHDRVALVMAGDWRTAVALVAATSAAAVAPLDPGLTDSELAVCLAQLAPRAVLVDAPSAARMRALAGEDTAVLIWEVDDLDGAPDETAAELPAEDDPSLLLFTSGTTAAPKVVQLTQRNLAAAVDNIVSTLRLDVSDCALNAMPLYHGHGIFPGTLAPLTSGGSAVCARVNTAAELLAVIRSAAPTWYSAAPVVHHSFLAMARSTPAVREELRLRAIRSTSSALAPKLLAELEEYLGAPVLEAYAASEAPGQITSNPLDGPRKPGTVGTTQPGSEVAVLTADGQITNAPGSVGEVLVRGAIVMPGYLGVPADQQPFVDGWLRTGDQGTLDEDSYLALSGRVVDVINRGAEKFSPTEVEEALAQHPEVLEVVVFGRSHPTLGEEAAAAVVLHEEAAVTEAELIAFAAERLAGYKVPVAIDFTAALPRGRTGKIVRRRLKEQAERSETRIGHRTASAR
ncbi:AMP-binding protein [Streptomyces sp. NBC_00986]|uniref:AMP-binding protein n=1 Tax=Streptomyces sp. NBC_00986 TaxID=2903702 RepID=UPI0038647792|nr:AMP-binding protein [Streptomyces sp. NBC_00986]